jgi:DNA-binding NarL/FixJ family response regulator
VGVPIRVVIGDDSFRVREGVRELLETVTDIDVVATCPDVDTLRAAVAQHRLEVVLTDIRMPPTQKVDTGAGDADPRGGAG